CGATLAVPAPLEALPPESAAPAAPSRPARPRRAPAPAPPSRPPILPVAVGAGIVVLGGAVFLLRGGPSPAGTDRAPVLPDPVVAQPADAARPAPPRACPEGGGAAAATKPAPDPKAALKQELAKRFDAAKTGGDVGALLEAAKFAEEAGLAGEARPVYEA